MQSKSQIKSIGIDLGKTSFHIIALGTRAQVVIRKKFSRVLPGRAVRLEWEGRGRQLQYRQTAVA